MPEAIPAGFDPEAPYHLTEDQHTALYQARHVLDTLCQLASVSDDFVHLRYESLAVTLGLLTDLLDAVQPNLVWRKPS